MKQALTSSRRLGGFKSAGSVSVAAGGTTTLHKREIKTLETQLSTNVYNTQFYPITSALAANDSAMCLNLIQQGTGDMNRVGKNINMKSLRVRGNFTNQYTLPVISNSSYNQKVIRMVIVHLKSEATAIPQYNQIFGGIDQTGVVVTALASSVLPYQMQEVTILRDKTFVVEANNAMLGTGDAYANRIPFDEYIDLKGLSVTYRGTANPLTISNIQSGAIIMYLRASYLFATDWAGIDQNGVARLRYTDN